jgi:MarR family transcriptional regulator, organic hydroperoxide resistance regulator
MGSKRKKRRHPLAVSSYPLPSPEAVTEMQRKLFSGRFADEHLAALLGRASVVVSAEFHEDVRRYQMPVPHWRIMACLHDNSAMSLSELTDLTLISQPTVTRLVQRLEKKGLIRKSIDGRDRRILRVTLTSLGHREVDELITLANERQKRLLHGLDAEALKAALHYLIAFCTAKRRRKRPLERMTY